MEKNEATSVEGKYDIFTTDIGETLIVLDGLDAEQTVELHAMQNMLQPHVTYIELFYWGLFMATIAYLVMTHVVMPLWFQCKKSHGT